MRFARVVVRNSTITHRLVTNRLAFVNTKDRNNIRKVVHVSVNTANFDFALRHVRLHALNLIANVYRVKRRVEKSLRLSPSRPRLTMPPECLTVPGMDPKIIDRIKRARLAAGLSQNDLAVACGTTNMSISRIERGVHTDMRASLLLAIADATGTSLDWIATGRGRMGR